MQRKNFRQKVFNLKRGTCDSCLRVHHLLYDETGRHGMEVDHIIPLSEGGPDEISNLQLLCRECHKTKTKWEGKRRRADAGKDEVIRQISLFKGLL
jgi:5-methylcytosine-specific restriction endonuclease McrA